MKSSLLTLAAIAFAVSAPAVAEPLKVVASFSIISDLAANIGQDKVEITTLVGPDSDAHVYEPKPADAAALAKAGVILANGVSPNLVQGSSAPARRQSSDLRRIQSSTALGSSRRDRNDPGPRAADRSEDHGRSRQPPRLDRDVSGRPRTLGARPRHRHGDVLQAMAAGGAARRCENLDRRRGRQCTATRRAASGVAYGSELGRAIWRRALLARPKLD